MRALFAGSFDPVTHGHLDLIGRVVSLVDSVVVAVATNPDKHPLFADEERVAILREVCRPWPTVEVRAFRGLVVDAARETGATLIVRGLRGEAEAAGELQMAQMNRALTGIETLLVPTTPQWAFVSSSLVKEIARLGGTVDAFVPGIVAARLRAHFSSSQ